MHVVEISMAIVEYFQNRYQFWFDRFLTPLDDPGSRLFYLNLLSAAVLAAGYVVFSFGSASSPGRKRLAERLKNGLGLRRKFWWNRSAKNDYAFYFLNSVLKVILFIPFLDLSFQISQWTVQALMHIKGDFLSLAPSMIGISLFTLASFVFDDFLRFLHHWLMHRVSWLWPFHVAHHSARVLTPLTLYRTHPVEAAMAAVRNSLSLGMATGAFLFLFDGHFHVLTLLGVNAFGQMFNFFGANLRHSQLPLSFGRLENWIISPLQHQIHHACLSTSDGSVELASGGRSYGNNFGVSMAIWDRMLGSLLLSASFRQKQNEGELNQVGRSRPMRFGVEGVRAGDFSRLFWTPFREILSRARRRSQYALKLVSGVLQLSKGLDRQESLRDKGSHSKASLPFGSDSRGVSS